MVRAEDLVEHERDRVKTLEQTLKLLQSSSSSNPSQSQSAGEDDDEDEEDGDVYGSKIEELDMKGLSVMQRRRIMMLRNKRDKLEKERSKLGLGEA
jgi:DASH complex subunit SPC19